MHYLAFPQSQSYIALALEDGINSGFYVISVKPNDLLALSEKLG